MNEDEGKMMHTGVPDPLEVMRRVLRDAEFDFDEEEGILLLRLALRNMDVTVMCWGQAGDAANIAVRLPIRATEEFVGRAGEFLHRLNYAAKRKFWEIDYDDGEIRVAVYTDTVGTPLDEVLFRSMFYTVTTISDVAFPYLTSVLSGRMTPEFAADQAEAAIQAFWKEGVESSDGDGKETD